VQWLLPQHRYLSIRGHFTAARRRFNLFGDCSITSRDRGEVSRRCEARTKNTTNPQQSLRRYVITDPTVFKITAIDRSAIPPHRKYRQNSRSNLTKPPPGRDGGPTQ
jgi:hypothetical protein